MQELDDHETRSGRRQLRTRVIRWARYHMAAEYRRWHDWDDAAEDDLEDSATILPLVEDHIPGHRNLTDLRAAYVTLLVVIMSFIAVASNAAYQNASMISAYKHAKTCTGTPPATLDPACITLVGFEDEGFQNGSPAHPGSELTLSRNSEDYGTVSFPSMTRAISNYQVPYVYLGFQVEVQGGGNILGFTEPGFDGAVWHGEVVWVADANGVRYQSADVPGGAPVVAITTLSALSACFLLVLYLRRKYGSRRRTGQQSQAGLGPVVALIALAAMTFGITELALGAGWAAWITAGTPPLVYAASVDYPSPARTVVRWPARS